MDCKQFHKQIDDYCDGLLGSTEAEKMQQHGSLCSGCRQALEQHQAMIEAMRSMPAPQMRPGFAQQAIKRATEQSHHSSGFVTGFGSALVAGLALWMMVAVLLPDKDIDQGDVAQVMLSLHQESTINLAFNAPKDLQGATITLTLPENIEVVGFPGQRTIAWNTSLKEGKNILSLPLKASTVVNSHLVASIESGSSKKQFRIHIEVTEQSRTEILIQPIAIV